MGLGEKPPPQLGQTLCKTVSTQFAQNVHSYVQMQASVDSGGKSLSHSSQFGRSSKLMIPFFLLTHKVTITWALPWCAWDVAMVRRGHSRPSGFLRHCLSAVHPSLAEGMASYFGIYGLMSKSGVPSSMSAPSTIRTLPYRRMSLTIDIPIPFGLHGCLEAKMPWGVSSKNVERTRLIISARSNR